jgi:hypothetical protein
MKIYLDMDGVLANFDKQYELLFGVRPKEVSKRAKHFSENWDAFVIGNNFTKLDLFPGAAKLMAYADSLHVPVEILSSSGGTKWHFKVSAQKHEWLRDHGIKYKVNIVPGGHKKAEFAGPWNILIDDTLRVVENYRKAGGTAILHTDADKTIAELSKLYLEYQGGQ